MLIADPPQTVLKVTGMTKSFPGVLALQSDQLTILRDGKHIATVPVAQHP